MPYRLRIKEILCISGNILLTIKNRLFYIPFQAFTEVKDAHGLPGPDPWEIRLPGIKQICIKQGLNPMWTSAEIKKGFLCSEV